MTTFTLLSDFDGVWTDQALEAEYVKLFMTAEAARLAGVSPDEAAEDFRVFEQNVLATPDRYGWAPDGRITAYVDEDPFCVPNAMAAYLDCSSDPRARRYREGILSGGFPTMNAFADTCFFGGMQEFRNRHRPALVPDAKKVVDELHRRDIRIVVVSNSPAEKIVRWFQNAGIDAGVTGDHAVRVRGQAGKQTLGPTDEAVTVGGRPIRIDRPRYAWVLREERPDAVVGDVFSLDLALPHALREAGEPCAPRTLVLRRHPHTPDWVLALAESGPIDHVIEHVSEMADVLRP